jgi:trk system potassium uptake protein TrkA
MKIVVVGGGKVGFSIASQVAREGHDVTLVDNNRETVTQHTEALDIMVMLGNGASLAVQREAKVGSSDLLIAATRQDELNMMCCVLARKLGCPNTIARVRNPEYTEQLYLLREELGLSMTVNPEWTAAREIFRLLQYPGFLKRDSFAKGRVEIVAIAVKDGSPLRGARLMDIPRLLKLKVLVCAVQRGPDVHIPDGSFSLESGDEIYVTAPAAELVKLMQGVGLKKRETRNVLIVGGSSTARYLTEMLLKTGVRVKLIEKNQSRSLALAEALPDATVICADGSMQSVLRSENIGQMDSVVTLTDMDEENIIISMYANHVGVSQVITKINRTEYIDLLQHRGIDCVISPKQLCAIEITRYVRAMQNTSGDSVLTMHPLVDGRVEALEFEVTGSARHLGRSLAEIRLKPNILFACINRRGRIIIPGGGDTLEVGDTVVVVTAANRVVLELNDIFADGE